MYRFARVKDIRTPYRASRIELRASLLVDPPVMVREVAMSDASREQFNSAFNSMSRFNEQVIDKTRKTWPDMAAVRLAAQSSSANSVSNAPTSQQRKAQIRGTGSTAQSSALVAPPASEVAMSDASREQFNSAFNSMNGFNEQVRLRMLPPPASSVPAPQSAGFGSFGGPGGVELSRRPASIAAASGMTPDAASPANQIPAPAGTINLGEAFQAAMEAAQKSVADAAALRDSVRVARGVLPPLPNSSSHSAPRPSSMSR